MINRLQKTTSLVLLLVLFVIIFCYLVMSIGKFVDSFY